jgi:Protein of unknown function (DUF3313)
VTPKRTTLLIAGLTMALLVAACAGSRATQTGFLANYEGLSEVPAQKNILLRKAPAAAWPDYRRIIIEPVVFEAGTGTVPIADDERKSLVHCFEQALTKALGDGFDLVDTPGPGTLRIRSAITGVDASNPALNVVTTLALFIPLDSGGVSVELEVQDSVTGRPLAAIIAWGKGSPLQFKGNFQRFGHARSALATKAVQVGDLLTRFNAPQPGSRQG